MSDENPVNVPSDKLTEIEGEKLDKQFETNADQLEQQLEITEDGKKKTASTIYSFLKSYIQKPKGQSRTEWLTEEFKKYPELWNSESEAGEEAKSIVETIENYDKKRTELEEWKKSGKSRESWLAKSIEETAMVSGAMSAGEYAGRIESALEAANQANLNCIYTNSGNVNMSRNLDGFIAEQQHVSSFNIDAATQNKPYRAEVLLPKEGHTYGKNSVDIVIKDTRTGKIVRRYQSKYGADADASGELFKKGDYRGQRRLVPKGQSKGVENSFEQIEIDGVKSTPLSKDEAKRWQASAQENERTRYKRYRWDNIDKVQAAKAIGKQAGIAAACAVGFQGARIVGRRIWNALTGKENQSAEADVQEFVESSLAAGGSVGLTTAVTGGVTIAAKSGWLGATMKGLAKGNVITNAVCISISNIKTVYHFAKGEISASEALDAAGDSVATFIGGGYGWGAGALIGSVLGPAGTAVGTVVGGVVGAMAGSKVGHAIYEGGKKIAKGIWNGIKSVASGVCNGVKSFFKALF